MSYQVRSKLHKQDKWGRRFSLLLLFQTVNCRHSACSWFTLRMVQPQFHPSWVLLRPLTEGNFWSVATWSHPPPPEITIPTLWKALHHILPTRTSLTSQKTGFYSNSSFSLVQLFKIFIFFALSCADFLSLDLSCKLLGAKNVSQTASSSLPHTHPLLLLHGLFQLLAHFSCKYRMPNNYFGDKNIWSTKQACRQQYSSKCILPLSPCSSALQTLPAEIMAKLEPPTRSKCLEV